MSIPLAKNFHVVALVLASVSLGASCSKVNPAGFWATYQNNLIEVNDNSHGPYGGYRTMYWRGSKANAFADFLPFTNANGWTLVDSAVFNLSDTSRGWEYGNKSIFPLSHDGFVPSATSVTTWEHFPRYFGGKIRVYTYNTGWALMELGTDNHTFENGFVMLDSIGTQMAVYHLWGE